jgi:antitoxin VapB
MQTIAKVFTAGNSQAVRLPKAFRVNASEVWITRNEVTGEITLKPKDDDRRLRNLEKLFRMIEEEPFTEDFVPARTIEESRNPLQEWAEPKAAKGRGAKR